MRARTVLILALAVASLAGFVWLVERDLPSSEERAEAAKRPLRFELEEVESVAVTWGGVEIRAERIEAPPEETPRGPTEGGAQGAEGTAPGEAPEAEPAAEVAGEAEEAPAEEGWRLVEPVRAPAERWEVEGLLRSLTRLETERTLSLGEEAEPGALGLDPPRGRITLRLAGGEERTLLVGAPVPVSSDVVVSVSGSGEAEVVPDAFLGRLERLAEDPDAWRAPEAEPSEAPAPVAPPPDDGAP